VRARAEAHLPARLYGITAIAITPDGKTAYVTHGAAPGTTVTPIDLATNTPGTDIPVGRGGQGIAITPDGKTAYVVNSSDNTVTPITVATNAPGAPITVGNSPRGVAVSPDGTIVYVTNQFGNSVTPITVATNTAGTPITVGANPFAVAFIPAPTPTPIPTPVPTPTATPVPPTPSPTPNPNISQLCRQNDDFGFSHGACVSLIQSNEHSGAIFPSLCKNLQQQEPDAFNALFKNVGDCVSSLHGLLTPSPSPSPVPTPMVN